MHIADITFIFSIPLLFVSVHPEEPPLRTLGDRGAAEKTIDFWIDKLLNAGDISEPDETIDDQWAIISEDYREINYYRDHAEVGLAYGNLPCIGAEVQLPFGGVKQSGNGYPSAREVIEAVTDRTAWTLNDAEGIELAQGLSAEITTGEEDS